MDRLLLVSLTLTSTFRQPIFRKRSQEAQYIVTRCMCWNLVGVIREVVCPSGSIGIGRSIACGNNVKSYRIRQHSLNITVPILSHHGR